MATFNEESPFGVLPRVSATHHEIGQMLDLLSISELRERILVLMEEVARLEAHVANKEASRHAADTFFKI